MKTNAANTRLPAMITLVTFAACTAQAQYEWSADFNDGQPPAGALVRGAASIQLLGGVGSSPHLSLTPSMQGMEGDILLPKFWPAGETPAEFTVRFSVKMNGNSGGVIGDGFSVSFAEGIADWIVGEGGIGPGPKLRFDTYDNDGSDGGIAIHTLSGTSRYRTSQPPNRISGLMTNRNDWYAIEYRASLWSHSSSMKFNGVEYVDIAARSDMTPMVLTNGQFVMGARTGDAFNAHRFDNLSVVVTPYPVFIEQPQAVRVTSGSTPAFSAQTNFNTLPWRGIGTYLLAASATTEWQIRHPGGAWTTVPDTTEPVLWGSDASPRLILHNLRENAGLWDGDDPALSIDGTEVRCVLHWHNGYQVTTQSAVIRLMPLPEDEPGAITLFNAFPLGHASVQFPYEDGKVLRLTPAAPDCLGGFVLDEIRRAPDGQPHQVTAFSASFQYRGTFASEVRADGFSFNVATDPGDAVPHQAVEEGVGTGLTISFDAYVNAESDPPGIDVLWRGQLLARIAMSPDALFSDEWQGVFVRVEPDGTIDLALNGNAVVFDLPVPGWTALREPRIGLYGRTGSYWQQQDVRMGALSAVTSPLPPAPGFPQLEHRVEGQTLRLIWLKAGAEGFSLHQSEDLQAWVPSSSLLYDLGNRFETLVSMEERRRFFRLKRN